MNKSDLIQAVANRSGLTKKDSASVVEAILDGITGSLANGESVQLVGFGTFEIRSRQAREGRNPATGETIKIEASKAPAFKAGKALKDKVK